MYDPRKTPIQRVADLLPRHSLLRHPIRARMRLPLDSPPEILLAQLDQPIGPWPALDLHPVFPSGYPPPLILPHEEEVANLLSLAFTTRKNARLEWLGDALVAAAIALSARRHLPDCNTPSPPMIIETLGNKMQLAHLGLLYGLQLHEVDPAHSGNRAPGKERMCDLFEAVVAAVALHSGFAYALEWLVALFDPWVVQYCATRESGTYSALQRKYEGTIKMFHGAEVAELRFRGINFEALAAFGPERVGWSRSSPDSVHGVLSSSRAQWPSFSAFEVHF
ncbi:hypothetical protein FB451DRAFT_1386213 [Mycena latifolia]|nr:hypothetical protein FB451DRAFT_1386213 [Mycena latifolia]